MLPTTYAYLLERKKEYEIRLHQTFARSVVDSDGDSSADTVQADRRRNAETESDHLTRVTRALLDAVVLEAPTQVETVQVGHTVFIDFGFDPEPVHILGCADAAYASLYCGTCNVLSPETALGQAIIGAKPGDAINYTVGGRDFIAHIPNDPEAIQVSSLFAFTFDSPEQVE